MKRSSLNQTGFIPLLIAILLIVVIVIYLVFTRVLHAKN